MDTNRFDRITRQLAQTPSRRRVLQGIGGGLVASVFAAFGRSDALADPCKAGGKPCKRGDQCCSGQCIGGTGAGSTAKSSGVCSSCTPDTGTCTANGDCCSGICQGGTCVTTVAGTCAAGTGISCDDPSESSFCGNGTCTCTQDPIGNTVCVSLDGAACTDDCLTCQGDQVCIPVGEGCCGDRGFACVSPCPPSGGQPFVCFTGDTRIAMADGTSKPIERVAVGDHVLGQTGINRVVDIERPTLESKPLYALNDGPFFVTADHPFLTETGWKAINPLLTVGIPNLVVGRLAVGDRLLTLAGVPVLAGGGSTMEAVIPELVGVAVERIEESHADPATPIYNLRLDGDHTYFANDMVVHNR